MDKKQELQLARLERMQKAGMRWFVLTRALVFGVLFGAFVYLFSPPKLPWFLSVPMLAIASLVYAVASWYMTLHLLRQAQRKAGHNG